MRISNILIPDPRSSYKDIYVVSEDLMEADLSIAIESSPLSDDHCQFFLYQILRAMKYVHSAHVIHRDLKPRNLLVNTNCDLKVCDFRLARVRFSDKEWVCPMTEYICTRWYRAPEVLCSWADYSGAIDVWSIGCILVEMLIRRPLFCGRNTQHQLDLIINHLGTPNVDELMGLPNIKCQRFIQALPKTAGTLFSEVLTDAPLAAKDLIAKTLRWHPDERVTVVQALEHPFMEVLHCPDDEPTRSPLNICDFEFERRKITLGALREEMFREALEYYPHLVEEGHRNGVPHDMSQYRLLAPGESQYSSDESESSD